MENEEQFDTPLRESVSSSELIKGAKGYTWKIKVYNKDIKKQQENIKAMDDYFSQNYGGTG